jgi:hypothetical protein
MIDGVAEIIGFLLDNLWACLEDFLSEKEGL